MDCCARILSDSSSGTPLESRSESCVKVSASTSLFTPRFQGNRSLRFAGRRLLPRRRSGNRDFSASSAIASRRLPAEITPDESCPWTLRAV